ncbi:MAG: hypothetical protein ABSA75_01525 [Candidatus Bathyarchaeia archaeon]|jgi:hypothetical protein
MKLKDVVTAASLITSLLLLVVPYILFPQDYIPKANPVDGYVSPKTPAAWAILIVALALLGIAIFAFISLAYERNRIGSKWSTWPYRSVPPRLIKSRKFCSSVKYFVSKPPL